MYRRVGAFEHDRHIRSAMTAKIDVLQAGNVPQVAADSGYAALVQGVYGPMGRDAQRDYDAALRAAKNSGPAAANVAAAATPRRASTPTGKGRPTEPAQTGPTPPQTAPDLKILDSPPQAGDSVFVPKECGRGVCAGVWSSEGCDAAVNSQGVPSCECDVTGVTSWRDGLITGIFHVRVIFTRGP